MSRTYSRLLIKESDRIELEQIAARDKEGNSSADQKLAKRAKMILACGDGEIIGKIAEELGERANTVIKWRDRYKEYGLLGLYDKKKSGRDSKYDDAFHARVMEKLAEDPPDNRESWDGPSLAKALNVPPAAVWKLLRKEKITLARRRVWEIPAANSFGSVSVTVAGVYLSPEKNVLVLLKDTAENSSVGKLILPNKTAYENISSLCDENGTITLYNALEEYNKDHSFSENMKSAGFQQFIDKIAEHRETANMLAIVDREDLQDVDLQWKLEHPNISFRYEDHIGWKTEVELMCELLMDQENFNLSGLLEQCVENKCQFEWYQ